MVDAGAIFRSGDGKSHLGVDSLLTALVERQHGVFARRQALELGLTDEMLAHRLRARRLRRIHAGVYAIAGVRLTRHGRWMAAVLAAGPDAVLSHAAAAALWNLRRYSGPTEVTTPRKLRPRPTLLPHCRRLPADEITIHAGIPTTAPARTILDLAARLAPPEVELLVHEAEVARLTSRVSLPDLLERHPRQPGVGAIRAALRSLGHGVAHSRSELERAFRRFLIERGIERPLTNAMVDACGHRYEVDCLWPAARLIVELDGRATHDTDRAFETDRLRDRHLLRARFRVIRVTWVQLHDAPADLEADLLALLAPH